MIRKEDFLSVLQIREMAKACTLEQFRNFLDTHYEIRINEVSDGEWIDFDFQNVSFTVGWDYDGCPYLSNWYQYWDEDGSGSHDSSHENPIYFRKSIREE